MQRKNSQIIYYYPLNSFDGHANTPNFNIENGKKKANKQTNKKAEGSRKSVGKKKMRNTTPIIFL